MTTKIITNNPNVALASTIALGEGVEPALLCAIVMTESSWRASVSNTGPGDAARGGAYGLGQITLQTAHALGFKGEAHDLTVPVTNLHWMCELIKSNTHAHETPADCIARYNSGKPMARAPHFTVGTYVPRVLNYLQAYRAYFASQAPKAAPQAAPAQDQHLTLASAIKPV